jgi:hypothetical protein
VKTDPTGRSFLSYRRSREAEAGLLTQAQHDHGIPTWQDIRDLGTVATEDELRHILADPATASAVLLITPEVETSPIIRNVEVPKIVQRAEMADGFFVVPVVAGGLDYARAAQVTSNHLSAQNLADWNMHRVDAATISPRIAAEIANRILVQRLDMIHTRFAPAEPVQLGFFVRRPPPFQPGVSLSLDWSGHFSEKETSPVVWRDVLLPALQRIANAIRQHAPSRDVEAFGLPTLPAATALGCAFASTGGIRAAWRQITPGQIDQLWTVWQPRVPAGFSAQLMSKDPHARDIAVLVSVTDNVEPLFATYQRNLPSLRAVVRVVKTGSYPHRITAPGEATDIAVTVQEGMRNARREYGNLGIVHLFMAVPAGLAMLVGQVLNTFGVIQTYEHVTGDGSGKYRSAACLHPNT